MGGEFHNIWRRMKTKCKKQNEKDKNANILICESWLTYDNFKKWCEKECKDDTMFFVRRDFTKDFCPDNCTFIIGLLHDFGYEFSTSMSEHPKVGADILENMKEENLEKMIDAIRHHGNCNNINCTVFDFILNEADMSVDSKGNNVSMQERLKDIGRRYGTDSRQYLNAEKMIEKLKKNNYT